VGLYDLKNLSIPVNNLVARLGVWMA